MTAGSSAEVAMVSKLGVSAAATPGADPAAVKAAEAALQSLMSDGTGAVDTRWSRT